MKEGVMGETCSTHMASTSSYQIQLLILKLIDDLEDLSIDGNIQDVE